MTTFSAATFLIRRHVVASSRGVLTTSGCASLQQQQRMHDNNICHYACSIRNKIGNNNNNWIVGGVGGSSRNNSSNSSSADKRKKHHRQAVGGLRKKKPSITSVSMASAPSATSSGTTTATVASTIASTANESIAHQSTKYAHVRMAPHMIQSSMSSSHNNTSMMGGSILEYMKNNPLLFAVVVFPTVTMGLLLVAKPTLRPEFMSGGKEQSKGSRGSYIIPEEEPVYESSNAVILQGDRDGNHIGDQRNNTFRLNEDKNNMSSMMMTMMKSTTDKTCNSNGDGVNGSIEHRKLQWNYDGTASSSSTPAPDHDAVIDLISAIGIRPHSSTPSDTS